MLHEQLIEIGSDYCAGIHHGIAKRLGFISQYLVYPYGRQAKRGFLTGVARQHIANAIGINGHQRSG